jgi:hypothetical protein
MSKFAPQPDDLRKRASLFWPKELLTKQESVSIIPLLVATQDRFISILDVSDKSPDSWKNVLHETKGLPPNLFLKHLMVLSDLGGEPFKRLRPELPRIFPDDKMIFLWQGASHTYTFKQITNGGRLDSTSLFVDGKSLAIGRDLDAAMEDVIMLLLFGAAATNARLPDVIGDKCMIGSLIGRKPELQKFVRQRYILVSRITAGATANSLGQIAQDHVCELLRKDLPKWKITRNGRIPRISQNAGNTDMNFDVVAKSPSNRYFAIEVSYQVTTNSVIERKAGQAEARATLLHKAGHKISYVIDGAGNFERIAALRTICSFSDCTVAFTPSEIKVLVEFLIEQA